mmetsp:Transcript_6976/g.12215  ORF Transcript_6976/g.12215 Transcript_6976/m.12215 type:complete len:101 (-) Transcript_6976:74-376(-)
MKKFDENADGKIQWEEFKNGLLEKVRHLITLKNEKKLKIAFDEFDKDGDGVLTVREIVDLMNYLKVPEEKTKKFMKQADENNDGKITFDEFCNVVRPKKK